MACTHCCATQEHFDARTAERDLRHYKQRGVDSITRLMLSELRRRPMRGRDLLDVGAGIGVISAELAESGVTNATVVEASPAYLNVARREVGSRFGEGLVRFILGDFTSIAPTLEDADVVTLGRVVCCYSDAEALLSSAVARTRRILAFTYPRYHWYIRAFNAFLNLSRRLKGNAFRTYIHAPQQMQTVVQGAGLVRVAQRGTPVWMLDVYERT